MKNSLVVHTLPYPFRKIHKKLVFPSHLLRKTRNSLDKPAVFLKNLHKITKNTANIMLVLRGIVNMKMFLNNNSKIQNKIH